MYIKDPLERQFYAQMCSSEHWDTRTLYDMIDKQLYLQTALSRKSEEHRNTSDAYQGAKYFSYYGKVLNEIRKEKEIKNK